MKDNKVINLLKKVGAILTDDHFVLTSGRHTATYINKDFLYPHVKETAQVAKLFAEKFKNKAIDVVAAPAVGGTILCTWTAYYLSKLKGKEILSVYTEKDKGTTASASESDQIFRRGYDKFIKGKKVLVLEDLTTTGISVRKTVAAVKKAGGKAVAVCVMVNRDSKRVDEKVVGAPFHSLAVIEVESYPGEDCPLCKRGVPVNVKIGHGKKFLEHKK